MSLLNRQPVSIGREIRSLRDDRVFVVATDDTYAPSQYFEHLPLPRVKVVFLPTSENSGLSSPRHVVDRLKDAYIEVRSKKQIQDGDEFWVFLDTDHHLKSSHLPGTLEALLIVRQAGFEIAISNPCFELWLLLHHVDVAPGTVFANYDEIETRLKEIGPYNKNAIKPGQFPMGRIPNAIRRARALDTTLNAPWPETAGTRVYRLLERILPFNP